MSLVHPGRARKYQDVGRRNDSGVASEAKRELALPEGKDRKHRQRRLPRRLPPRTHPFPAALDVDDRGRAQRPPALLRQQTRQEHSTTHTRAAQQHSEARSRAGTAQRRPKAARTPTMHSPTQGEEGGQLESFEVEGHEA